MRRTVDWPAKQEQAEAMTDAELRGARASIIEALPAADALDREFGSDNGGYYRDEASVYAQEQRRRASGGRCKTCGAK